MVLHDLAQLKPAMYWRDPIVIVGAGPTGMITALGLARYNVPCIILDDHTGPSLEGSRAFLINRHTLEILGSWSNLAQIHTVFDAHSCFPTWRALSLFRQYFPERA
jgi:2-polyprenyl-6-methoxyphenol hydroxylase-like FAD-dependent oxidoreductase